MSRQDKPIAGKAFDLKLFRRIFAYVKPYKVIFILCMFTTILLSFLTIARPLLVAYTIDNFVVKPNMNMLLTMTLVMIGLLIVEAVLNFINDYYTSWLGQNIIRDMRVKIFRHIITFRTKYFDNTPIGLLVTRTISDIEAIADIFSQGFIVITGDILTLAIFIAAMFWMNWELTLWALATLPLLLFSAYIFKNAVKHAFQDVRTAVAHLNTFVQEHITGMNIVQIFNREKVEMEKFKKINAEHRAANIRAVWSYSVFFPVVEILAATSIGLVVWKGGEEIFSGAATPGEITFFIMLVNMFFRPIRMLADRVNVLQMGMVASERVFKVMDINSVIDSVGKKAAKDIQGNIEFRNVWFAYNNEDWVIRNLSFSAKSGETIALVGATGAGKTSVINLLNRFYEYNKGEILLDGINIRDYELNSLRNNIGVVLQDVFLFSGTVANNISLNNPELSREKIIEASKRIGAHGFISKLPDGYDFNVMERGGMLSVGQRQMISFIRAYLYNPRILVLDEATSSIDTETEQLIQYATTKLTENRTCILIAHRLATIQKADRILVFEKGEIIEQGSHRELLKQNGQYKKLVELQFNTLDKRSYVL